MNGWDMREMTRVLRVVCRNLFQLVRLMTIWHDVTPSLTDDTCCHFTTHSDQVTFGYQAAGHTVSIDPLYPGTCEVKISRQEGWECCHIVLSCCLVPGDWWLVVCWHLSRWHDTTCPVIITNAIIARLTDQSYDDITDISLCVMQSHHNIAHIALSPLSSLPRLTPVLGDDSQSWYPALLVLRL